MGEIRNVNVTLINMIVVVCRTSTEIIAEITTTGITIDKEVAVTTSVSIIREMAMIEGITIVISGSSTENVITNMNMKKTIRMGTAEGMVIGMVNTGHKISTGVRAERKGEDL